MLEGGARGGRRPEGAERVPASRAESRSRLLLGDLVKVRVRVSLVRLRVRVKG